MPRNFRLADGDFKEMPAEKGGPGLLASPSREGLDSLHISASAQFSQAQEYKADEHGCQFAIDRGKNPYSIYNALEKLMQLSDGGNGSVIAHMFADHPKTEKRMERMKKMADNYTASKN